MNKFVVFLMILFCQLGSLNAQKIKLDRIEEDGRHQIMTTTNDFYVGGNIYSFGLKVFESSSKEDWLLLIAGRNLITDSTEVLLRLGNEDIIYLPVNNTKVTSLQRPAYSITTGNITRHYDSYIKDFYYSSVYVLTEEYMDKIEAHGIKKIRINNGVEFRDGKFYNNPIGKFLTRCRKKIKERQENPIKEKKSNPRDLFDGF